MFDHLQGWPIIANDEDRERRELRRKSAKPTSQLPSADTPQQIVLAYTPPKCPECGGRLDMKPTLCISRLHLMKYEQRRESNRLRQTKHRSK